MVLSGGRDSESNVEVNRQVNQHHRRSIDKVIPTFLHLYHENLAYAEVGEKRKENTGGYPTSRGEVVEKSIRFLPKTWISSPYEISAKLATVMA